MSAIDPGAAGSRVSILARQTHLLIANVDAVEADVGVFVRLFAEGRSNSFPVVMSPRSRSVFGRRNGAG